ncbi:hypothetical protein CVT25_012366 [Psilocybe cyanescens]|uniref:Uncharacterized protein n=1 Tax=Psilocybe cyanescens TaxID=93625 RepID=A0A409XBZ2_PSICY|nr:hypothetical protein CVT25_012366 [Psilocybe cyanescens]
MISSGFFFAPWILFFTKIDLFAGKLPRSPFEAYFLDYQGGNNCDAACDDLLHRFVGQNQSAATKQIHAHYTDTLIVLSATKDILPQLHLRESGLLQSVLPFLFLIFSKAKEDAAMDWNGMEWEGDYYLFYDGDDDHE